MRRGAQGGQRARAPVEARLADRGRPQAVALALAAALRALELEFEAVAAEMDALVAPLLQRCGVAASSLQGREVCVLADAALFGLPLEALQCLQHCSLVTRDLSLPLLAARWAAEARGAEGGGGAGGGKDVKKGKSKGGAAVAAVVARR